MAVQPIPAGYHTVTPYLMMKNASKAIQYYQQAFGATELFRMPGPDDAVMHAELQIGTSRIMLADDGAGEGCSGPTGERLDLIQTERIGPCLDGTLKVIEGRGHEPGGAVGFQAFAILTGMDARLDPAKSAGLSEGEFIDWLTIGNQAQSVVADVKRIREHPLVPRSIPIYGYIYASAGCSGIPAHLL